jgi:hypothetical protein
VSTVGTFSTTIGWRSNGWPATAYDSAFVPIGRSGCAESTPVSMTATPTPSPV